MTNLSGGRRLIFVGGAPRSGTTLVQNMLDSHPAIFGGPEFIHIPDIINLRKKLHHSISRKWIDLICSYDDVDNSIRSLIEDLLIPFANRYDGLLLSEKTPQNVLVFSDLISLFPHSRFIYVVRDPRDIVTSMLKVGTKAKKKGIKTAKFTTNLNSAIAYTKKCFKSGFDASKIAPDKVYTVVYESLVTDPVYETKKICNFLKIEWSSKMLDPGRFKHIGERAITLCSDEIWYDSKSFNRNPEKNEVDKWKKLLNPKQKVKISKSFYNDENLMLLGYDFSFTNYETIKNYIPGLTYEICGKIIKRFVCKINLITSKIIC